MVNITRTRVIICSKFPTVSYIDPIQRKALVDYQFFLLTQSLKVDTNSEYLREITILPFMSL